MAPGVARVIGTAHIRAADEQAVSTAHVGQVDGKSFTVDVETECLADEDFTTVTSPF